ncbi:MAG: hypothetical protein FWF05_06000 [Oscillospiraceae bacterium]|nr:hypothetical protein [Oscillospiraceae bacterium]
MSSVKFELEKSGYNKEQVDGYVKYLSDGYQTLYDQYTEQEKINRDLSNWASNALKTINSLNAENGELKKRLRESKSNQ